MSRCGPVSADIGRCWTGGAKHRADLDRAWAPTSRPISAEAWARFGRHRPISGIFGRGSYSGQSSPTFGRIRSQSAELGPDSVGIGLSLGRVGPHACPGINHNLGTLRGETNTGLERQLSNASQASICSESGAPRRAPRLGRDKAARSDTGDDDTRQGELATGEQQATTDTQERLRHLLLYLCPHALQTGRLGQGRFGPQKTHPSSVASENGDGPRDGECSDWSPRHGVLPAVVPASAHHGGRCPRPDSDRGVGPLGTRPQHNERRAGHGSSATH